jgi:hypothetical protein
VIYWGGRRDASRSTAAGEKVSRTPGGRVVPSSSDASRFAAADASSGSARRVDVLIYRPGARTTEPGRVIGAKPAEFCRWVFDLLGAEPQDEFTDLFAGSGGVARAWSIFSGVAA